MKTLLILILAVVCIFLKSEYFFTTNNMLMYEFLISALPSFVLSLQPNTNRVKGKFIPYVLSRALPGSITIAMGILTLHILRYTSLAESFGLVADGAVTLEYQALLMIVLTFAGIIMLYRICQPLNILRFSLVAVAMTMCIFVLCIPFLGNITFNNWTAVEFTFPQILLLIIILQAAFPVSAFLIKAFDLINPAED